MHYFSNKNNIWLFASQMQIFYINSLIESAVSTPLPGKAAARLARVERLRHLIKPIPTVETHPQPIKVDIKCLFFYFYRDIEHFS